MLPLRLFPLTVAFLVGCSDDPHARILAAPPVATTAVVVAVPAPAPPPAPAPAATAASPSSPIEEHAGNELDRFVFSSTEIVVAVFIDDTLYVARTTDGGRTWTRRKLDLGAPTLWYARFDTTGTKLHVEMLHGMNSTYDFTFATRDRGVTWKRLPGGGFRMKPPPKITSSSSSSRS